MTKPTDPSPPVELGLDAGQRQVVLAFLDDKESSQLIEAWLAEWGISSFKAKLVVKLLLPALQKLLTGVAERGLERLHETLCRHFGFYDNVAARVATWLFYKVESRRVPEKLLKPWMENAPAGTSPEDWAQLNQQTRVELTQLEKLNLLALALHDLKASVSLQIDRPSELRREPLNRLLRPHNGFIPVIARESELEELGKFCDRDSRFQWMVLTGDGGVGKTRLALDFAAERERNGWSAGFLSAEALKHWVRHDGFPHWSPLLDTLVVIDYAASKAQDLKPLLERFVRCAGEGVESARLRLLLLEREADAKTGWLHELAGSGEGALRDEIGDSLAAVREIKPPGREAPDEVMLKILRASFESWSKLPGGPPAPQFPALDEGALREIRRCTLGRPLFLQMAALRACADRDPASLASWTEADLLTDAVGPRTPVHREALGRGRHPGIPRRTRRGLAHLHRTAFERRPALAGTASGGRTGFWLSSGSARRSQPRRRRTAGRDPGWRRTHHQSARARCAG